MCADVLGRDAAGRADRSGRARTRADAAETPTSAGRCAMQTATAEDLVRRTADRLPNLAPQMRVAFSSMASNTGSSSPGELEMTFSTSRGRGLLLQRLGQIVGALAQFVEQPRVLDGDDRLGGEVLHQLDLLVGERPHLLAIDHDRADRCSLSFSSGTLSSVRAPARSNSALCRLSRRRPDRECGRRPWCEARRSRLCPGVGRMIGSR